jgi:hypothetical protein
VAIISLSQLQTVMIDTSLSASTATSDLAQACIDDAEAKVREMLAKRYDVAADYFQTTTSVAPALVPITRWLAAGYAYTHFSRGGKDAFSRADHLEKKAMDNISLLLERKADLVDQSGNVISERADAYQVLSNTDGYTETFGEDDPRCWSVDPDKLDDIKDERES